MEPKGPEAFIVSTEPILDAIRRVAKELKTFKKPTPTQEEEIKEELEILEECYDKLGNIVPL